MYEWEIYSLSIYSNLRQYSNLIEPKYTSDKLWIVYRTYPECACALCKAAWDHAEVLGSSPAIGKAVNAEGGNCNGNPFLSNIFVYTDLSVFDGHQNTLHHITKFQTK